MSTLEVAYWKRSWRFRVDAIYHAFEIEADENGNYPDEPRNDWTDDPDEYGYTHKVYTVDQPETPHLV